MSIEVVDGFSAELARLNEEWRSTNAAAAALLKDRALGQPLSGYRRSQFERLEAHAASLASRYHAMILAAAAPPTSAA
jgi:hypothetical protein